jgi:hypothetical protein
MFCSNSQQAPRAEVGMGNLRHRLRGVQYQSNCCRNDGRRDVDEIDSDAQLREDALLCKLTFNGAETLTVELSIIQELEP